ncbi:hypothetical protein [Silvimonas sp.]|uniref:hypothetical protein n=1 Tax=Silvimonas sp. TaxID=2650811 RepID=UPI002848A5B3|nr:hypothetical protein [Silvimonas sp.]MDR3427773.1 hypothetical protein [Silvimonas sp.]
MGTQTLEDIFREAPHDYHIVIVEQTDGRIIVFDLLAAACMAEYGLSIRPEFVTVHPDIDTAIAAVAMQLTH